jgi:transcriptional regulator with XRE-family HTH domain
VIDRIKKIMDDSGLTAAEFARKINIQPARLSHILTGRNKPGLDIVQNILEVYPDIDPEWLVLGRKNSDIRAGQPEKEDPEDLFAINSEKEKKPDRVNPPARQQKSKAESSKSIKKLVILYSDGSFDEFNPSKD